MHLTFYRDVYNDLLRKIYSGEYRVGDKLPPMPALSKAYNVGMNTVKRAVRMLQQEGIVCTGTRNGTIIILNPFSSGTSYKTSLLPPETGWSKFDTLYTPALLFSAMSSAGFQCVFPNEKDAALHEIDAVLSAIDSGEACGALTQNYFKSVVKKTKNPFLISIYEDITKRFVLFVPSHQLNEKNNEKLRVTCQKFYEDLKALLVQENIDGAKDRVYLFYEQIYQIPQVLLFSSDKYDSVNVQGITLYEQVLKDLLSSILGGQLKRGDKLPTELQLCTKYHVSRTTIRKAYGILKDLNLVESQPHNGTTVITDKYDPKNRQWVLRQVGASSRQVMDSLFALWSIAPEICREGAKYISPETIIGMRTELDIQWMNCQQYNVPLLVTGAIAGPIISVLNSSWLTKYYYYAMRPLLWAVTVGAFTTPNCSHVYEQIYQAASASISALEKGDHEGFVEYFKKAGYENCRIFEMVFSGNGSQEQALRLVF